MKQADLGLSLSAKRTPKREFLDAAHGACALDSDELLAKVMAHIAVALTVRASSPE